MSAPAYQIIPDRWPAAAPFGTCAFGTAYFGGADWAPATLPRINLGSDDVTRVMAHNLADIVLTRNGRPVSIRPYADWGKWAVRHAILSEDDVEALWAFCKARVFHLLPSGDPTNYRTVYWAESSFHPEPIGNGYYSLAYTLEEVAS